MNSIWIHLQLIFTAKVTICLSGIKKAQLKVFNEIISFVRNIRKRNWKPWISFNINIDCNNIDCTFSNNHAEGFCSLGTFVTATQHNPGDGMYNSSVLQTLSAILMEATRLTELQAKAVLVTRVTSPRASRNYTVLN
jgi:hypothetical protein